MEGTFHPDGIVVGVDSSTGSHDALDWAADHAARERLPLHVVAARSPQTQDGWDHDHEDHRSSRQRHDELAHVALERVHERHPELTVSGVGSLRRPAESLVRCSQQSRMVVIGCHGEALMHWSLGSTAQQVATHAACSVAVVRGVDRPPFGRILLGLDQIGPGPVLDAGLTVATAQDADVVAVHAWNRGDDPSTTQVAQQMDAVLERRMGGRQRPKVRTEVVPGHAARLLVQLAHEHDTLVIGARGRGGFPGLLLGRVALTALHRAACTVVIAR